MAILETHARVGSSGRRGGASGTPGTVHGLLVQNVVPLLGVLQSLPVWPGVKLLLKRKASLARWRGSLPPEWLQTLKQPCPSAPQPHGEGAWPGAGSAWLLNQELSKPSKEPNKSPPENLPSFYHCDGHQACERGSGILRAASTPRPTSTRSAQVLAGSLWTCLISGPAEGVCTSV